MSHHHQLFLLPRLCCPNPTADQRTTRFLFFLLKDRPNLFTPRGNAAVVCGAYSRSSVKTPSLPVLPGDKPWLCPCPSLALLVRSSILRGGLVSFHGFSPIPSTPASTRPWSCPQTARQLLPWLFASLPAQPPPPRQALPRGAPAGGEGTARADAAPPSRPRWTGRCPAAEPRPRAADESPGWRRPGEGGRSASALPPWALPPSVGS